MPEFPEPEDDEDMTYEPVSKPAGVHSRGVMSAVDYRKIFDVRTSTERIDELAGALKFLTEKVNQLERKLEEMQGD